MQSVGTAVMDCRECNFYLCQECHPQMTTMVGFRSATSSPGGQPGEEDPPREARHVEEQLEAAGSLRQSSDSPLRASRGRNPLVASRRQPGMPWDAKGLRISQRARDLALELFSPNHAYTEDVDTASTNRSVKTPSSIFRQSPNSSYGNSGSASFPLPEEYLQAGPDERDAYAAALAAAVQSRPKEMKDALQAVLESIEVVNEDDCEGFPMGQPNRGIQLDDPVAAILAAAQEMEAEESLAQEGIYESSFALDDLGGTHSTEQDREDRDSEVHALEEVDEADCLQEENEEEGEEEESELPSSPPTSPFPNHPDPDSEESAFEF